MNDWLSTRGKNPLEQPMFKLVWSDNEIEKRHGTYEIFYGDIFVRTEVGLKEVPKYSYISERWVLEMWVPYENVEIPETVGKGSYEPFWVFQDKQGNYLRPTIKALQFLVEFTQKTAKVPSLTRAAQLREEDQIKFDQEVAEYMDRLDTSPLINSLSLRDAVGYRGRS